MQQHIIFSGCLQWHWTCIRKHEYKGRYSSSTAFSRKNQYQLDVDVIKVNYRRQAVKMSLTRAVSAIPILSPKCSFFAPLLHLPWSLHLTHLLQLIKMNANVRTLLCKLSTIPLKVLQVLFLIISDVQHESDVCVRFFRQKCALHIDAGHWAPIPEVVVAPGFHCKCNCIQLEWKNLRQEGSSKAKCN